MTVFTRTWDAAYEADPDNTDQASLYAQEMRQLKVDIRERLTVDHSWDGDADDGIHEKVNFEVQGADPTPVTAGEGVLYTKLDGAADELYFKDGATNVLQLTKGGGLNLVDLISDVVLDNDVALQGENTGATARDLITLSAADNVDVGNANEALRLLSDVDIDAIVGAVTMNLLAHEGRHRDVSTAAGLGEDFIPFSIQGVHIATPVASAPGAGANIATIQIDLTGRRADTSAFLIFGKCNEQAAPLSDELTLWVTHTTGGAVGTAITGSVQEAQHTTLGRNSVMTFTVENNVAAGGAATDWFLVASSTGGSTVENITFMIVDLGLNA